MSNVTSILLMLASVAIIALAILLVISLYVGFRGWRLYSMSGSFECLWLDYNSQKWQCGLGQYNMYELTWFRLKSISSLPELRWKRSAIEFDPNSVRLDENDNSKVIFDFKYSDFFFTLRMDVRNYEAFIAWIESGLPQSGLRKYDKHIY